MSLVLTRIQNIRANSNLDKFEYRPSRYGALNAFMVQSEDPTGILTEELKQKARTSIGNTLETPVISYDADITIGSTRTLTIADSENTSKMVQITFATYAWGFTIAPAMYMNNEIGIQKDFETKMMKYIYAFAKKLDEAALAQLAASKTQILKNKLLYDFSSNAINAKWAERENVFGDLEVMMGADDFYGQLHIVGDPGVESIMRKLQQHGLYNDVNKQNEFGTKVVHLTNNIAAAGGKYAQGYAVNAGSLGMLTRFERDCLLGTVSGDGHEWGIATLPLLNMPVGTYFYDSVGDYNTIAGAATADMTRTRKEHYGFAVDVAFLTAYNSSPSTLASPILAFNVSSEDAVYAKPVVVMNTKDNPVNTKEASAGVGG
jgi:MP1|nr:MAG TPA: major capsid protein [Caudoviricetes sp.]